MGFIVREKQLFYKKDHEGPSCVKCYFKWKLDHQKFSWSLYLGLMMFLSMFLRRKRGFAA